MILTPFDNKHIEPWQSAVDSMSISPSPLGGPEFNSTTIRGWGSTFLFTGDSLLIPVARSHCSHFFLLRSDVYTGVSINSLLGISEMNDHIWSELASLPRRCVIYLDLPEEQFDQDKQKWQDLDFRLFERNSYHKIDLPATYDEWFSRRNVRRDAIRRAEDSGLTVAFGGAELLEPFYQTYLNSYTRWQERQTASRVHEYVRFQRLFEVGGTAIKIAVVRLQEKTVAAAIFAHYKRTAGYLYGGIDFDYQQQRPSNLLHAGIVNYLIERGVSEYNLGMSLNLKGLEHFKETLGAVRHMSVTLCRDRFPRLRRILHRESSSLEVPRDENASILPDRR